MLIEIFLMICHNLIYSSAENEKETVHILYKTKYGNEIGNPEFNLYVDNIPHIHIYAKLFHYD
jgi:hypothetical protein